MDNAAGQCGHASANGVIGLRAPLRASVTRYIYNIYI
jgi:hypothetical protein